jgi:hypothetical protein
MNKIVRKFCYIMAITIPFSGIAFGENAFDLTKIIPKHSTMVYKESGGFKKSCADSSNLDYEKVTVNDYSINIHLIEPTEYIVKKVTPIKKGYRIQFKDEFISYDYSVVDPVKKISYWKAIGNNNKNVSEYSFYSMEDEMFNKLKLKPQTCK